MTMSEAPKKKGWEYAQEAKAAKRADKAAMDAHKAEKAKSEAAAGEVSNPDIDFNAAVIPMKLIKRAGVKTYADEVKDRLLDVAEAPDGAYFLLPVKLPKKVYKLLLEATAKMSGSSPDWTERDTIEAILLFSDLTKIKDRA